MIIQNRPRDRMVGEASLHLCIFYCQISASLNAKQALRMWVCAHPALISKMQKTKGEMFLIEMNVCANTD